MTPPNDAARPVAWIAGTPFGLGLSIPENADHIQLNVGERIALYTAADYDALRAEVEKLRKELREQANFYVHPSWRERCEAETARAEAAEAAEARIWKAETELNDWQADVEYARKSKLRTTYSIAAVQKMIDDFRAALNEGGE